MESGVLLYGLVIPIISTITLMIISFVIFLFISSDNTKRLNKTNIMFFELDLLQWRIKKKNMPWNKSIQKTNIDSRINILIDNGWVDINRFFSIFSDEDVQKWKNAIQYCVQNQTGTRIDLTIDLLNNKKSYWDLTMFYSSDNILLLNIKWTNSSKKDTNVRMIDKTNLLDEKNKKYRLFVSFNLTSIDYKDDLINKYLSTFKIKKCLDYFVFKKIIVFVHEFKTFDKMQRYRLNINQSLLLTENKLLFNGCSDAISYVDAYEIKDENDLVKILTRISFGISKSRLVFRPFYFSIKNIHFNEFEEYKETINQLNNVVKNQEFEIEKKEIVSFNSRNEYLPIAHVNTNITTDKNNWLPLIIETTSFNEKIRTLSLENELKKSESNDPIILDINDYDVNNFFSQMLMNKHITYIINVIDYEKPLQLVELLELLSKNHINYGLRINEITSSIFSIIDNSAPKLVIFSKELLKEFKENNFCQKINYIGLILMCERLSITPIFENIDNNVKSNILGIGKLEKYFYNV